MKKQPKAPHRNLEDFAGIASDWFWETDADHRFTYFSNRMEEVTKIPVDAILGTRRDAVASANPQDEMWQAHLRDLYAHRPFRNFEYSTLRPADGSCLWLRVAGQPLFSEDGAFIGYRGTGHDITHEMEAMERLVETNAKLARRNRQLDEARAALERAAYQDALTGLHNRRAFERDLTLALDAPDQIVGLLHVDLDRFKWVNDSLGHQTGDAVLIEAARRIESSIGQSGQVYRVGGDEFLIVIAKNATAQLCRWISDGIIERMAAPIEYDNRSAKIGASVGVALGQSQQTSQARLIAEADVALYEAKRGGRNVMCQLTPQMQDRMQTHRQFAAAIPQAIERGEFLPYFQPQIHVGTGAVVGAEALLRWQHPELGVLAPASFLNTAAELGLVPRLDQLMLREALRTAARLRVQGHILPSVSVNVSAARIVDPTLPDDIETYWQDRNCQLCVELLETIYYDEVGENPVLFENLNKLRDMGVRIETDDFGSGRASITGLLTVRPDRLKIDRALIQAAVNDPVRRSVVAAILEMTRALGIESIAEGVETEADIESIRLLGCAIFQGYALSRPLPEADLASYLAARHQTAKTKTAGRYGLPKRA